MTRFYEGAHAIGALEFFKSTATGPDAIAQACFRTLGRRVVIDQGYYAPMMRALGKVLDPCLLAEIVVMQAPTMKDYKDMRTASISGAAPGVVAVAAAPPASTYRSAEEASINPGRKQHSARARTPLKSSD